MIMRWFILLLLICVPISAELKPVSCMDSLYIVLRHKPDKTPTEIAYVKMQEEKCHQEVADQKKEHKQRRVLRVLLVILAITTLANVVVWTVL